MPKRRPTPDDEIRSVRAILRSLDWTGPRGLEERKITLWLHRLYRNHNGTPNLGATFELKDLARECDLVYIGTNRSGEEREYMHPVVRHYVQRMREAMEAFVEYFWTSPMYREYVEDGLSDEQIQWKSIEVMVSYDVFPVWCDREGDERWKLMDLDAYARLRELRQLAIISEVGEKSGKMAIMQRRFNRALPGKYHRYSLPDPDGFMALPAPPGGGIQCPTCGQHFPDTEAWKRHFERDHSGFFAPSSRLPPPPPSGLDALFDGDSDRGVP
jgi:hypothetical protein